MDRASLSDLNSLDRDALLALLQAQQEKLDGMIAERDEQLRGLEAELEMHRQTLSEQTEELRSRGERIEHLKLMVEKFRHMIFGASSEKIVSKLQQMELELEDTRRCRQKQKRPLSAFHLPRNRGLAPSASRSQIIFRAK